MVLRIDDFRNSGLDVVREPSWREYVRGAMVLFMILVGPAIPLTGQETEDEGSSHGTTSAPIRDWWTQSPASFDTLPNRSLYHIEGNYSLTLQSGNIEGSTHYGTLQNWLRRGLWTLSLFGLYSHQSLSVAHGVTSETAERYTVGASLDYAPSIYFGPEIGYYQERDDAALIDKREVIYGGVNIVPYSSESLTLKLLPAFGYQRESAILTDERRAFWSPYFEESVTWSPVPEFSLEHNGAILVSVEETDVYRWHSQNTLVLPLASFISLTIGYEIRYNNRPIPTDEALQKVTGGVGSVSRDDQTITSGIRVEY